MDKNTYDYLVILFDKYDAALEDLEATLKQLGASVPLDVLFCDLIPYIDKRPDFMEDSDHEFLESMRTFNQKAGGGKLYFQTDIQETRLLRLWLKYIYERRENEKII